MSSRIHPLFRALAAQAAAFLLLALLALAFAGRLRLPAGLWIAAQALLAALLGRLWGLRGGWLSFQVCLPPALAWQAGHAAPAWLYPLLLALLLLVYGGGLLTRVPLYHSNRAAWAQLLELMPERADCRVVDLGAGFGGPLAHLARHRPEGRFLGVEASPLPGWWPGCADGPCAGTAGCAWAACGPRTWPPSTWPSPSCPRRPWRASGPRRWARCGPEACW